MTFVLRRPFVTVSAHSSGEVNIRGAIQFCSNEHFVIRTRKNTEPASLKSSSQRILKHPGIEIAPL